MAANELDLRSQTPRRPFERHQPFDDEREVCIRSGEQLGFSYGIPKGERPITVCGVPATLRRYAAIPTPAPLNLAAGEDPPAPWGTAADHQRIYDVLVVPHAEVMIVRSPNGFSDEELEQIFSSIRMD